MKLLGSKNQEYLKKLHKMISVNSLPSSVANLTLWNHKSWEKKLSKQEAWDLVHLATPSFPLFLEWGSFKQ